ncbi:hypothetical protein [Geodermatophilus sp. SYSU D00710]
MDPDARFTAPLEKDGAFTATCMPSGEGPHWPPLRKAICQAIGKDAAGQEVPVHLQQRFS